MTLKEKCWGFHVRDDYSAERQQLVNGGVLMRKTMKEI